MQFKNLINLINLMKLIKSWSRSTKVFLFFSLALIVILIFSDRLFPPRTSTPLDLNEAATEGSPQGKEDQELPPSPSESSNGLTKQGDFKVVSGPEIWARSAARFVREMESCFIFSLKDYRTDELSNLEREKFLDLLQIYGQVAQRNEEFKEYHVELSSGRQRRLILRSRGEGSSDFIYGDDENGEVSEGGRSAREEAAEALDSRELILSEKSAEGEWGPVELPEDVRFNPAPNAIANFVNEGVIKKEIIKESFYFTQGEEALLRSQDEKVTDISISNLEKTLTCRDLLNQKMSCDCRATLTY
jgi:hypothetical protein